MDNFQYSIQLSDQDWAEFSAAAEECGLLQAGLASGDELLSSDIDQGDSSGSSPPGPPPLLTGQLAPGGRGWRACAEGTAAAWGQVSRPPCEPVLALVAGQQAAGTSAQSEAVPNPCSSAASPSPSSSVLGPAASREEMQRLLQGPAPSTPGEPPRSPESAGRGATPQKPPDSPGVPPRSPSRKKRRAVGAKKGGRSGALGPDARPGSPLLSADTTEGGPGLAGPTKLEAGFQQDELKPDSAGVPKQVARGGLGLDLPTLGPITEQGADQIRMTPRAEPHMLSVSAQDAPPGVSMAEPDMALSTSASKPPPNMGLSTPASEPDIALSTPASKPQLHMDLSTPASKPQPDMASSTPALKPQPDMASSTPALKPQPDMASSTPALKPQPDMASSIPASKPQPDMASSTPALKPQPDMASSIPASKPQPDMASSIPALKPQPDMALSTPASKPQSDMASSTSASKLQPDIGLSTPVSEPPAALAAPALRPLHRAGFVPASRAEVEMCAPALGTEPGQAPPLPGASESDAGVATPACRDEAAEPSRSPAPQAECEVETEVVVPSGGHQERPRDASAGAPGLPSGGLPLGSMPAPKRKKVRFSMVMASPEEPGPGEAQGPTSPAIARPSAPRTTTGGRGGSAAWDAVAVGPRSPQPRILKRLQPPAPSASAGPGPGSCFAVTLPEAYEFFFCDTIKEEDEDAEEEEAAAGQLGEFQWPDTCEFFFRDFRTQRLRHRGGCSPAPPLRADPGPCAPPGDPVPISIPEAYEHFFGEDRLGDMLAPDALLQLQALEPLPEVGPGPQTMPGSATAEQLSLALTQAGEPRSLFTSSALSQKDMCLVFVAFATWAVRTSDLHAPDAWKTVLLANLGTISAIRYFRRRVERGQSPRRSRSPSPSS